MRALLFVIATTSAAAAQPILSPNQLPAEPVEVQRRSVAEPEPPGHWLTLGAVTTNGRLGARAELDFLALGHWSLGVALAGYDRDGLADATTGTAGTATVYLAVATTWRGWHLRGAIGAGASLEVRAMTRAAPDPLDTAPIVEAGLYASRDLVGGWGLTAGPVITRNVGSDAMSTTPSRAISLFGGLTRRF